MNYLIQILLPLYDNRNRAIAPRHYDRARQELTGKFGGLTTYMRNPAEGLWQKNNRRIRHDDIVVFEVMTAHLNRSWWRKYRRELQKRFRQEVIVIRSVKTELL